MLRAAEIAVSIGANWPGVLEELGIAPQYLQNRHGPCPACGGQDRYRFDNKDGRGGFFCNGCGAGDGFSLLQRVHGWDFRTARDRVIKAAGVGSPVVRVTQPALRRGQGAVVAQQIAQPTARVLKLRRASCKTEDCDDVVAYFASRALWPHAGRSVLRAHPEVEYFEDGKLAGRYPSVIAEVRDVAGAPVSLHVTYLHAGRKLSNREPRKLLSPLTGREGCAVRLTPITGDTMGIAEGIETALAAAALHHLPVWAALNAGLLGKFTPPEKVRRLTVFADRDRAGLDAAARLTERLKDRIDIELRVPAEPAKDWADVLMATPKGHP